MNLSLKNIFTSLLLLFFFSSCIQYEEVRYSGVKNVSIQSFENNELKLKITVAVENPNSYKIKITSGEFNVKSDDIELGSFNLSDKTIIPAQSKGNIDVFVSTKFKSLFSPKMLTLMTKVKSNRIPITIEGHIVAKAKIFSKKVKFNQSEEIKL